ncbi:MAG TPA: TldD/PmbA family protein [Actinomycetota bacterium]|nr:TldD/PmbA family protein [Actinomycetota bacterium]
MAELLDLARSIVERAGGDEQVEAYVTHERDFYVKAYEGEVEAISSAEPRGAGVRLISGGRVGFAYTTDLTFDGVSAVVAQARDNAGSATPDEAAGMGAAWAEAPADVPGLVDEAHLTAGPDDKAAFTVQLEQATRAADPRIRTEEAIYSDSETEVAIATSTGIEGRYRRTDAWCYSVAIAEDGGDTQVAFEFDLARGLASLDADAVARRAVDRALSILGAEKIPSARMPVVFDPYTSGQFLGVVASALTGEAVQKGRSLFAGKIGEQVAAAALTLVDDGRAAGAPGSAPWDDEGTPTRRTPIIEAGTLSSFLYDVTSARREGRASTGNASRSRFKSAPHPAPTNLAFDSTGESRDEILRKAGRALLVQDFHGVHSGTNPISGDFSVGVTGRLIEDGDLTRPVREVTIAAPMLDILARVVAVATDRRWLPFGGSYGGATTLVSEMTVAGA